MQRRTQTLATMSFSLTVFAVTLMACCTAGDANEGNGSADAGMVDRDGAPAPDAPPSFPTDPFGAIADTSEGLTNVAADLNSVLENGALAGACADYQAHPADRMKRLLCGKAMFFYEGFGTGGVPEPIVSWLIGNFPDEVGDGFVHLGMIPDPASTTHLPLGMARGAKLGSVDTLAFTCASCHFAQLPDGRYAVGAPNHAYRYGAQNLMLTMLPTLAIPGANPDDHDPAALAIVQPLRDKMAADSQISTDLILALLPLITSGGGTSVPSLSSENEHFYATWRDGTMDFFIQPLPYDDGVHTISKISALWGLPGEAERDARGLPSAYLGWTGGTSSLLNFARGFVKLGGGVPANWTDEQLGPLVDYIYSLRAPQNPQPPESSLVAQGAALFDNSCLDCHDAPRGGGRQLYDFSEIGTDEAMMRWADGNLDGIPDNGIAFEPGDQVTHQIKSPRLVGMWATSLFLHNGSVNSLEALLCLDGPRGNVVEIAYGDGGHRYGCDLPSADRRALVSFLLSH